MQKHLREVRLFNTLTRAVEPLAPLTPGKIGIYCCGPTVYNYQHIGNLRTYIFEDLLVRTLRYAGYDVNHVMNITDVGHLVSDADNGEDKMLVAARREGKKSEELAEFYTGIFLDHCAWLNIRKPNIICKATEHIGQMIQLIERLMEKNAAYVSGGNVYFDVGAFEHYGDLARLPLEALKAGARIEVDTAKRSPLDFALWFTKSKFENQELQWDSPWGRGYPGWHIECSAMSMHYLGECFDIHCGGIDHIPVHHTNEIAQSEAATGKRFANVWMHGGFLVVGKDKMSKSTGEFLTLDVLRQRGIDPISYRLFCLSGSYRHELSWNWQALEASENALRRLKQTALSCRRDTEADPAFSLSDHAKELLHAFEKEIFNDLSMPNALAMLHSVAGDTTLTGEEKWALLCSFDEVLGLGIKDWQEEIVIVSEEAVSLAEQRKQARASRDWAKADELRAAIANLGYDLEDNLDGYRLKPKR